MNDLKVPLPARYPKIAVITLWLGAFGTAALISIFDAELRGQDLAAPIMRKTLLLGLLGLSACVGLSGLLVVMRVKRLRFLILLAGVLGSIAVNLWIIARSLPSSASLDIFIGLIAVISSMGAYSLVFFVTIVVFGYWSDLFSGDKISP